MIEFVPYVIDVFFIIAFIIFAGMLSRENQRKDRLIESLLNRHMSRDFSEFVAGEQERSTVPEQPETTDIEQWITDQDDLSAHMQSFGEEYPKDMGRT